MTVYNMNPFNGYQSSSHALRFGATYTAKCVLISKFLCIVDVFLLRIALLFWLVKTSTVIAQI